MRPAHLPAALLAAALAALALAGCGTGGGPATATTADAGTTTSYPVTVGEGDLGVALDERPERIVSLSPTATEILFAIEAGDQVIAVDDQSNYPEDAPQIELSGLQPNVEAIAGYEPDLVVISYDPGELVQSLEQLDIPVLMQPAAAGLTDTYAQVEQLGLATGNQQEAAELVDSMQERIDEAARSVPDEARGLSYYHELDPNRYTASSETFVGRVYDLFGLRNVADEAAGETPYPQLSNEYLVDADPDVIFLADTKCCDQSLKTLRKRPGWKELSAVQRGAVVELDDDVASRWGPRVADLAEQVAAELTRLAEEQRADAGDAAA